MDGNGRWAQQRDLPRTKGHEAGEKALFDVVCGALELGLRWVSVYAFSTENWRRPVEEVRFLMNYNEDVLARRREELNALNVRIRWAGRRDRLASRAVRALEEAQELTRNNTALTLCMCINYGGRAELAAAASAVAREAVAGRIDPAKVDEEVLERYLDEPDMPDVDLFIRTSGEQRLSNFLLWQSAYAELAFVDTLWPDFDRLDLWQVVSDYVLRARRFGGV